MYLTQPLPEGEGFSHLAFGSFYIDIVCFLRSKKKSLSPWERLGEGTVKQGCNSAVQTKLNDKNSIPTKTKKGRQTGSPPIVG